MAWRLEGTFFEACPCDTVCPCITSAFTMPADVERCLLVLVWHIDSGEIEGVDVSGLSVALFGDTPPVMADGNWRVGMFMDEAATEEQAEKLGPFFSGQVGGPMEMFAAMTAENLGMEVAPIEYADDGRLHRVKIGDFVELEVEDFVPPQKPESEPYKLMNIFHPVSSTLTIGQATTSRVNAFGYEYSTEGKYSHSAPFSWAA